MKINRLAITGFGPYRTEQIVDFDAYAGDGIFLISGKTGAGKSSILDAISFALYDSVPRYDGTKGKLRSDHCAADEPTLVALEFTVGDARYRVSRSPEYEKPKKRGTGMTTQKPTAQLEVWRDGDWEGIAAGPGVVAHEIEDVVGLKKDQFLQVILLAQNRFQRFLLAGSSDREAVLRSLFGTSRFSDYEDALVERRRELESRLAESRAASSQLVEQAAALVGAEQPDGDVITWLEQAVLTLGEQLAAAVSGARAADTAFGDADARRTAARELQRRQQRRADAERQKTTLDDEAPRVDKARLELRAATTADALLPYVEARQAAAAASADADAERDAAQRAYAEHLGDEAASGTVTGDELLDALEAQAERLSGRLARLEDALTQEKTLPGLRTREADAAGRCSRIDTELQQIADDLARIPERIAALGDELTAARVRASGADSAGDSVSRLEAARAAAELTSGLTEQRDAARAAEAERVRENTAASQRLQELLDARLAGHAAELAAELVDGEACAVCGATQHPSPAVHDAEPVTEADIEQARDALSDCEVAKEAASTAATQLEVRLAEQRAAAEGKTVQQIDAELAPARQKMEDAHAAAEQVAQLEAASAQLVAEREAAEARREKKRGDREAASAEQTEAANEIARIAQLVESNRGDSESIAAAVDKLTQHREAATRLSAALRTADDKAESRRSAEATLAEKLAERAFESEERVQVAKRSSAEQDALQRSIRVHDDASASVASILAEAELQDLPDERPDLETSERARAEAQRARDEANRQRDTLAERHQALVRTVLNAKQKLAASADLTAEFESVQVLANTLAGKDPNTRRMRLESYVLAAELEQIVAAANARLGTMSGGRYALEHDDSIGYRGARSGLGLAIFDQHTGQARATHSLSGGETFLASLALALGLAEVVTNRAGGITLDTLFIDEGFGSLDADTLEIAMSTLDSLRAGGRTVGLISHVEGMKEQIPAKLRITVADGGWSEIHQDAAT